MKKIVLLVSLLVLLSTLVVLKFPTSVEAHPAETITVPDDYEKIQWATGNASDGDTIFVKADTYYEHVVVNKSVSLIGEDRSTTVIDGNGIGLVIRSNAPDVEIRGFTVQNGGDFPYSGILIGRRGVRNSIRDCIIRNNCFGIELHESDDCTIVGNKIMSNSWAGIHVKDSSNNAILNNIIADNSIGVYIPTTSSLSNKLYRNNFINNLNHSQSYGSNTKWDNGAEGNYWDDYSGKDSDGDGIGDTPYIGIIGDSDKCPLMEPWSLFRKFTVAPWNQNVTTFCNATVASFKFNQSLIEISFNVTGPSGAISFCNVTIPNELIWGNFTVLVNGETPTNLIPTSNSTHNFFYFTIEFQSTSRVKIKATEVVPEFPTWTSTLLILIVLTVAIAVYKRKLLKTSTLKTNPAQT